MVNGQSSPMWPPRLNNNEKFVQAARPKKAAMPTLNQTPIRNSFKTCGAKQSFFWQTSLKKWLNCAAGIAAVQRALALIVLSALAFSAAGCAAGTLPGKGRVVDKVGKPMAGVHTLAWRKGRTKGISLSWTQSPPYSCTSEHYAISDANGEFVIPTSVIERPFLHRTRPFPLPPFHRV
jgi:hypothetical protein